MGLLLMGGDVGLMICAITRITYPTYCTINAIEKNNAEEKLRWAQFWIVENCLQQVEHFFSTLLKLVVPLYWLIRFTLLLWLMAPVKCNGASVLYNRLVKKIYHNIADAARPRTILRTRGKKLHRSTSMSLIRKWVGQRQARL